MQKKWKTEITSKANIFRIDFQELWRYRDLCFMFIRKNYVTRYKQTVLGPVYMLLSPLLTSGLFSIIFGVVAGISTDGIPDFLFFMSGNIVWSLFTGCIFDNSNTFIGNAYIMGKVYFPRLVIPASNTLSKLLSSSVQFILFIILYIVFYLRGFHFYPNWWLLSIPLLLLSLSAMGVGLGLILSALTVKYRDFNIMLSFGLNLFMYLSPVIFPVSSLPGIWKNIAMINPVAAVIETLRYAFFGMGIISIPSMLFCIVTTIIILFIGVVLFNKVEKTFIDTV